MNFIQPVKLLRGQLLSMSRLSQRALDYSIKGYEHNNSDICRQVRSVEHKLGEHHRHIKYLCRQITVAAGISPYDLRFALAALRIESALNRTYSAAAQMAQDTILFLKTNSVMNCAALDRFGMLVNSLVRLCVVALYEREVSHAEMVLQNQGVWRRCELIFDHSSSDIKSAAEQDIYALAITQSLGVIAKQAHEMADAILFWLKGRESALTLDTDGYDVLNFLFARYNGSADSDVWEFRPCGRAAS